MLAAGAAALAAGAEAAALGALALALAGAEALVAGAEAAAGADAAALGASAANADAEINRVAIRAVVVFILVSFVNEVRDYTLLFSFCQVIWVYYFRSLMTDKYCSKLPYSVISITILLSYNRTVHLSI